MDTANPDTKAVAPPQNSNNGHAKLNTANPSKPNLNGSRNNNTKNSQNPPKMRQERNGNKPQYQGGQNSQNFEGKPRNTRRGGGKKYNRDEQQHPQTGEGGEVVQPKTRGGGQKRISRDPNVTWLRNMFNGYYADELLYRTLEQNNFDLERTRQQLQAQKESSWSNIVVKSPPLHPMQLVENFPPPITQQVATENPLPFQDPENYQPRQKPQRYRKTQNNVSEPMVLPKVEEYNADEKIEAIQSALEIHLSAMETKTEKLKRLQEDIRKIKSDRDVKIELLCNEKELLLERSQQLKQEIVAKEHRVADIDVEVAQLKQDKIQKIRSLEEESRAVLEDK